MIAERSARTANEALDDLDGGRRVAAVVERSMLVVAGAGDDQHPAVDAEHIDVVAVEAG